MRPLYVDEASQQFLLGWVDGICQLSLVKLEVLARDAVETVVREAREGAAH